MRTLLFALAACVLVTPVHAATFLPTRFDDPSPDGCLPSDCSLREAVIAANATAAADSIVLGAGDYLLERQCVAPDTPECGDLDVDTTISIGGGGSAVTFVTNTTEPQTDPVLPFQSRILDVDSATLGLDALTVRRGVGTGSFFGGTSGGCLSAVSSNITLNDVVVTDCRSNAVGGAIHLQASQATLQQVTISSSWASGGGGLALSSNTTVHGSGVSVENNGAFWGGGVVGLQGTNTLRLSGLSTIAGNHATEDYGERRGGGIFVVVDGTLVVDSDDDDPVDWLRIEANEAALDGGGASVSGVLDLSQVRLIGNLAQAEGGALYVGGRLFLSDAEIASNVAGSHGGGVSLPADGMRASRIERASFEHNTAGGNGGAVAAFAPRVWLVNVSSHANAAVGSGGGFHIGSAPHAFRFNTSFGDTGQGGSALHAASPMQVEGSLLAGSCTGPGTITNLGYNVRAPAAAGCPGIAMSSAQMALVYADWGGPFAVVGFGPTSLLAGLVPAAAAPPALDSRGFTRPGPVFDPGAFEHDARGR